MTAPPSVGILGGGQLAQMLARAGDALGLRVKAFDPHTDACCQSACELVVGSFDDQDAIASFARSVDIITCEFESVPIAALQQAAKHAPVHPGADSFFIARNRVREKEALARAGWRTADYAEITTANDIAVAAGSLGFPSILKAAEGGYDGYSQRRVNSEDQLAAAWKEMGSPPAILEKLVPFTRELSIIGCRAHDGTHGTHVTWPIVQNHHDTGILLWSLAPAPSVEPSRANDASDRLVALMDELNHVGVMALEMFDTPDGLVANEIAPRVHNSGHWTIQGASVSQFENHMRAIVGRHMVIPELTHTSVMVNLLGSIPQMDQLRQISHANIHVYGKSPRCRRKVGHVTLTENTINEALAARDRVLHLTHTHTDTAT